ncbi:hypothetical protein [Streptomyces aureocirculatus]|uniref:hypothetical protein n=1 Tax=Streptomyces aureocirculatus TaxID=67275 RepID=UPI0004C65EA4|nr:hypothetical protein [Streptomyces aureocirculatus]
MATTPPTAPVPNAAEVLRERYTKRLPVRLEDLTGPAHGTVDLPLHVAWSGRRSFDVDRPRARMGLYRTVLAEGQREDLISFLNHDLLLRQWPVLRTLISRSIREVWEDAFPVLVAAGPTAA